MDVQLENAAVKEVLQLSFDNAKNLRNLSELAETNPLWDKRFETQESFTLNENSPSTGDEIPQQSLLQILVTYYPESYQDQSIKLKMTTNGPKPKYLHLQFSSMILDKGEYRVATFLDETDCRTLAQVEQKNHLLSMLQSSVTHDMLTPLKCIISFAKSLDRELIHSNKRKDA